MRKIREDEVTFTVGATQDHASVRGNALASGDDEVDKQAEDEILARLDAGDVWAWASSGDDEVDKQAEDEILARLDAGDVWAWASVKVTATLTLPDGSTIEGHDYLGCCSYKDEEDFKQPGDYYDDMKHEALADLQRNVEAEIARGAKLAELFAQCEWATPDRRCELAPGHEGGHVLS